MKIKIKVGIESLRNYQRMPYSLHGAIGELIDNSIQAFEDEKKDLKKAYKKNNTSGLEITINYDNKANTLRIVDNSTGIERSRLEEAFSIGSVLDRKNAHTSMGQFNIGMKAASIWLCDEWTIKTKRYDSKTETQMAIVNEEVFSGNDEIVVQERTVNKVHKSYTVLEFDKLRHKFNKQAIKKTIRFISSMYRLQLKDGSVKIKWNDKNLEWEDRPLAKKPDGTEWKIQFGPGPLPPGNEEVKGWIGVLSSEDNATGRLHAGINIIRRRRVIPQGDINSSDFGAWRPKGIFGGMRNDRINQRLTGEIYFDQSRVTYDKTSISPDHLEALDVFLTNEFRMSGLRQRAEGNLDDTPEEVKELQENDPERDKENLENLQDVIEHSDLGEISNVPIPADDLIKRRIDRTFKTAKAKKEDIYKFKVGSYTISLIPSTDNEADPFIAYKSPRKNFVEAVINMHHPYITNSIVTRTEYYKFLILMIASRYKIEMDDRLTMNDYLEVLDKMMRLQVINK